MSEVPTHDSQSERARPFVRGGDLGRARAEPGVTPAARRRWSIDLRGALKRVPRAAWMCALIALLNAAAWSLITPPFQGRDEVDHFAYVAQLAETGTLPENGNEEGVYSPQETLVLKGLHYYEVRFTPSTPTISSLAQQRKLIADLHAHASLKGSGEAGVATPEPPLYYALQTIPYFLGRGNMLLQLQIMRLFGVFLGALTTLLTFLFIREAVPRVPWAGTVGALCVALQPQFAFMSGSVNPDTLLFTVSAAIFLCLARGFRRGFTRPLAVVLGLLIATGFVTKLNFIGFAAGAFLGLGVLGLRQARIGGQKRKALVSVAIAAGIGIAPVVLYALWNISAGHAIFGSTAETTNTRSVFGELSYIWELYLPRLPGMTHYFNGMMTYKDVWFDRSVGLYGWMDTMFPTWVDNIALVLAGVVALLCGRELLARREVLRKRLSELAVYATITLGVLVLIGVSSYHTDVVAHGYSFGEPRYLLPMLPLFGAAITLAVRGGRRWAPVVGAAMIMLFMAHDVFSQLQVIARYYS